MTLTPQTPALILAALTLHLPPFLPLPSQLGTCLTDTHTEDNELLLQTPCVCAQSKKSVFLQWCAVVDFSLTCCLGKVCVLLTIILLLTWVVWSFVNTCAGGFVVLAVKEKYLSHRGSSSHLGQASLCGWRWMTANHRKFAAWRMKNESLWLKKTAWRKLAQIFDWSPSLWHHKGARYCISKMSLASSHRLLSKDNPQFSADSTKVAHSVLLLKKYKLLFYL